MHGRYTTALCDILGFSKLVQNNPLDTVVDNVLGWFRKALHHAVNKDDWPDAIPPLDDIDQNSRVGLAWFSDTILLFTREDTDDSLGELIQTVAWLLFATTIEGTTRMRAGIAYGDAFIDPKNAMYVGTPIIDAYRMEQRQQWSGAALTESAVERVREFVRDGGFGDWPLLPYDVPLKNKETISTLAINWTCGIHHDLPFHWSQDNEAPTPDDWAAKPSICEKWQNTKQFHTNVCTQCQPHV